MNNHYRKLTDLRLRKAGDTGRNTGARSRKTGAHARKTSGSVTGSNPNYQFYLPNQFRFE